MRIVRIDARRIVGWDTFHDVFAEAFAFPEYYGRNMNAWIDCMRDQEPAVLQIDHVDFLQAELYSVIVDSVAFVNWRCINVGESAILTLSYNRTNH